MIEFDRYLYNYMGYYYATICEIQDATFTTPYYELSSVYLYPSAFYCLGMTQWVNKQHPPSSVIKNHLLKAFQLGCNPVIPILLKYNLIEDIQQIKDYCETILAEGGVYMHFYLGLYWEKQQNIPQAIVHYKQGVLYGCQNSCLRLLDLHVIDDPIARQYNDYYAHLTLLGNHFDDETCDNKECAVQIQTIENLLQTITTYKIRYEGYAYIAYYYQQIQNMEKMHTYYTILLDDFIVTHNYNILFNMIDMYNIHKLISVSFITFLLHHTKQLSNLVNKLMHSKNHDYPSSQFILAILKLYVKNIPPFECPIFYETETEGLQLPCKHVFCIDSVPHIIEKNKCPLCRNQVFEMTLYRKCHIAF